MTASPLDVHMGYELCDLVHAGGWVGMIKLAPLMEARGIHWCIWCCRTNPEVDPPCNGFRIERIAALAPATNDHYAIKAAIKAAIASGRAGRGSVVIAGSYSWQSLPMLIWAHLRGVRFIRDGQIMPDPLPTARWARLKAQLRDRLLTAPTASHFALSEELGRTYSMRYGASKAQVQVVRNGADTQRFRPATLAQKHAARAKLGLPLDRQIVLFCGGLIHRKGVDLLLNAWAQIQATHPSATLVLRGSIGARASFVNSGEIGEQQTFTETLYRMKAELPRPDDVIFAGHGPDVESYYAAADIFVFPSRLEGLPFAVIEAMSCGLPCVISPFVGMPHDGEELGIHGQHHLLATHEPEDIGSAISALLDQPEQARLIGLAARAWIEQTQAFETVADRWAAAYRTVAGLK
jgi:glycosyltransferase involved in cell wall biosynthesis